MHCLTIAKIINTHGVKGELKVACNYYGNNYRNWKANQIVYLETNNGYQVLTINTVRQHKNWLLISFKDYNDINAVLFMKNKALAISEKMASNSNLWFSENLVGYQAVNSADNKELGKITNLIDNSHTGLWEIIDKNKKSHYIPNNEDFINKIDKTNKIVYFNLVPGMFDYE